MLPLELTLVLAATRDMGIGLNGSLPWTGLKKEMAYFARVTKRLPPQVTFTLPLLAFCSLGGFFPFGPSLILTKKIIITPRSNRRR